MSSFKSTIWAYDYYLEGGLFKNAVFPTGIDPDIAHDVIIAECGEMQPLFTDADFMQQMIGIWSSKWNKTFERWLTAYNSEYDPIYNYDRHEEIEDVTTNDITGTDSSTVTNSRSAYDSSAYQPHDQSTATGSSGSNADGTYTRTAHMYGNIGVTTTQQMLEAEYKIAGWNIYEAIKDLFMQEFCVMIY